MNLMSHIKRKERKGNKQKSYIFPNFISADMKLNYYIESIHWSAARKYGSLYRVRLFFLSESILPGSA